MNRIHFLILFLTLGTSLPSHQCSKPSIRLITSKRTCLSQSECPPTHFCNTDSYSDTSFTCVPLLRKHDRCNIHVDYQCQPNLYCTSEGSNGGPARCQRGSERTEQCDPNIPRSCAGFPYDACSQDTKTCIEANVGKLNDKCITGECKKSLGLYCDSFTCKKKKSIGGDCSKYRDACDVSTYCDDPFPFPPKHNQNLSFCIKASHVGQKCLSDKHCKGSHGVCNIQSGKYGKCIPASQRVTKPGIVCNPKLDTCDGRRGLLCQKYNSRHVCMQQASYRSNVRYWMTPFCTPHNKYSKCMPYFGRPTECRLPFTCNDFPQCEAVRRNQADPRLRENREYVLPTKFFPSCYGKRTYLEQGAICNIHESEICGPGLLCHFVPSVKDHPNASSPERTRHCVKTVKNVNGDCSDPFLTTCGIGMSCVNGRCRTGEKLFKNKWQQKKTHLGIHAYDRCDKSKLPCAPGLVCDKNEGRCNRPKTVVKKGQPCYEVSKYRRVSSSFLKYITILRKERYTRYIDAFYFIIMISDSFYFFRFVKRGLCADTIQRERAFYVV